MKRHKVKLSFGSNFHVIGVYVKSFWKQSLLPSGVRGKARVCAPEPCRQATPGSPVLTAAQRELPLQLRVRT